MSDNFITQQVGPKSDGPVKEDSPSEKANHDISTNQGGDVFSALLLLALIGGKGEAAQTVSPGNPSMGGNKDKWLNINQPAHLTGEESGKPVFSESGRKVSSEFCISEKFKEISGSLKDIIYPANLNADKKNSDGMDLFSRTEMMTAGISEHGHVDSNISNIQPLPGYIDQENIMQQLSQRLSHSVHIGTHTARIRLQPKELGDIQMNISVNDKSVNAIITVENSDVKGIIEANLNRLEQELKNQGLSVEQFSVEMKGGDLRDGYMSSSYKEDRFSGREVINEADNNRIGKEVLDIPVKMDMGVVSLFA